MTEVSRDAQARLEAATDARGRALEIVHIPSPGPLYLEREEAVSLQRSPGVRPRTPGERLAASYVNFYPATGRVVYPLLDERHDEQAGEVLGACFPEPRGGRDPLTGDPARGRQHPLHHPAGASRRGAAPRRSRRRPRAGTGSVSAASGSA